MHVAERCCSESALQRQDSPSLGPWDACPSKNPFAQFHISPNCKEREFLSEDELKAVVTHEFEDCSCFLQIFYSPQMNSLARMLDSNVCQNKVTGKTISLKINQIIFFRCVNDFQGIAWIELFL